MNPPDCMDCNCQRLEKGSDIIIDIIRQLVHPSRRVVQAFLERALKVRKFGSGAAETEIGANVVTTVTAEVAVFTGDADFERDLGADREGRIQLFRFCSKPDDLAGGLVAET